MSIAKADRAAAAADAYQRYLRGNLIGFIPCAGCGVQGHPMLVTRFGWMCRECREDLAQAPNPVRLGPTE